MDCFRFADCEWRAEIPNVNLDRTIFDALLEVLVRGQLAPLTRPELEANSSKITRLGSDEFLIHAIGIPSEPRTVRRIYGTIGSGQVDVWSSRCPSRSHGGDRALRTARPTQIRTLHPRSVGPTTGEMLR